MTTLRSWNMKNTAMLVTLATLAIWPLRSPAQSAPVFQPTPEPSLTLQADGVVERAPDQAKLSVQIVTNDDNATVSSSRNNDIYNAMKAKLGALALSSDAIRTLSYNVQFIPHPPRGLPPEQQQPRYGYVTTRAVQITSSPIENIGKVVDAATSAGVTDVGNITFDLKDRKSAYDAALASAMGDVRKQAAVIASAGGFTLVRIRDVSVGSPFVPGVTADRFAVTARAAPMPATPTEIEPSGPIRVTAHVSVTYTIR